MADFPPNRVPMSQASNSVCSSYYQNNSFPSMRPGLEQPPYLHGPAGLMPGRIHGGFPRLGVQGWGPHPVYGHGYLVQPLVQPQVQQQVQPQVHPQVQRFMDTSTRAMQQSWVIQKQLHDMQAAMYHNSISTRRYNAKRVGTGVYLPAPFSSSSVTKRQQGAKSKGKIEVRESGNGRGEESSYQLPPDINLPEEWPY